MDLDARSVSLLKKKFCPKKVVSLINLPFPTGSKAMKGTACRSDDKKKVPQLSTQDKQPTLTGHAVFSSTEVMAKP